LLGGLVGGLSLLIFPDSFLHTESLKLVNLFVTPVALGLIMVLIGKLREKKGQEKVNFELLQINSPMAFFLLLGWL
jgi:hypothetical protein